MSLAPPLPFDPPPGRVTLRTLTAMRWLVVAGQLVAVLVVRLGFGFPLPMGPVLAVIFCSVAVNLASMARRRQRRALGDRATAGYLAYDILQLTALLYLTGGIENPFAVLLLGPLTVAAGMLSRSHVSVLALLVMVCLGILTIVHLPLPWLGEGPSFPSLYRTGVWGALWLAAGFIAIYNFYVADEARRIGDALDETQMALAREQRISALGALAAAAAHELGSPLGTIAIIAKELKREIPPDSPFASDIELLQSQSARCREILAELSRKPESAGGNPFEAMALPALLESIVAPYSTRRVKFTVESFGPMPTLRRAPELVHGLGNVIQNAMQFAGSKVTVTAESTAEQLRLRVRDDGPGFPPGLLGRLGEPYLSQRQDTDEHLGLGIFIAQTLLERTGADLAFDNPKTGGAAVTIVWRKDRLQPLMV